MGKRKVTSTNNSGTNITVYIYIFNQPLFLCVTQKLTWNTDLAVRTKISRPRHWRKIGFSKAQIRITSALPERDTVENGKISLRQNTSCLRIAVYNRPLLKTG